MTLRLPRIRGDLQMLSGGGKPSIAFLTSYHNALAQIETALNAILDIPLIQDALADLDTAIAAANTAAANAQAAADTVTSDSSLATSYVTGLTLSAADVGANVTVTISAHTRVYGDGTSVAVSGGTVTGVPYSTVARIYYDQPSRAGGAVTYAYTTSEVAAAQTGDRHSVGAVTTPAAAAPPNNGNPVRPPGYVEP